MKYQPTVDAAMPFMNPAAGGNYNQSMGFVIPEK
jgi:hypothetical protein